MHTDYIKTIMTENYEESKSKLSLFEYIKLEIDNDIASFDCFFELAADEILPDELDDRKDFIISIFN